MSGERPLVSVHDLWMQAWAVLCQAHPLTLKELSIETGLRPMTLSKALSYAHRRDWVFLQKARRQPLRFHLTPAPKHPLS